MRLPPLPTCNQGDKHKLGLLSWQIIGALSFRESIFLEGKQVSRFKAAVRKVTQILGVRFVDTVWGLKLERGRWGDRPHFHFVLAGLPAAKAESACVLLKRWWKVKGGGREADIEIFDPKRNGLDYLAKLPAVRPYTATWSTAKFGVNGEDILFSENFVRLATAPR